MVNRTDLENIGFENVGCWQLNNNSLSYNLVEHVYGRLKNVLYAFCNGNNVMYIGKTTRGIKKRFVGYIKPGPTQKTNVKCNKSIKSIIGILQKGTVEILVFATTPQLQWAGYDINLAAGLEDALIKAFNPKWNGACPKPQDDHSDLVELPNDAEREQTVEGPASSHEGCKSECTFAIQLRKTYYNTGFINPGKDASRCLGEHGRPVIIYLGSEDNSLSSTINREANTNGSVRIVGNNGQIRDWFQDNFTVDGTVHACVLSKDEIFLFRTTDSKSNARSAESRS